MKTLLAVCSSERKRPASLPKAHTLAIWRAYFPSAGQGISVPDRLNGSDAVVASRIPALLDRLPAKR